MLLPGTGCCCGLQMMTTAIYGVPTVPAALADEKGNAVVVHTVASIHSLEHMLRPVRPSFAAPPPPCLFPILAGCVFPYPFPYSPSLPYLPLLASDGPSSTLGLPHPLLSLPTGASSTEPVPSHLFHRRGPVCLWPCSPSFFTPSSLCHFLFFFHCFSFDPCSFQYHSPAPRTLPPLGPPPPPRAPSLSLRHLRPCPYHS